MISNHLAFKKSQVLKIFSDFLNNSLLQSMLIGPLMGTFFGILFSGLDRSPSANAPVTVIETKRVYREKIIYRDGESKRSTNNDPFTIAIVATFVMMFLDWKYAVYSELILNYLQVFILSTLCFSFATILVSLLKGHFNSKSWQICIVIPFIYLCFCLYLFLIAKTAIDPQIVKLAEQSTSIDFYTQTLTVVQWYSVVTQLLGVTALFFLVLFSTLIEVHYLALMNQRGRGFFTRLWSILTDITWSFSNVRMLWFLFFLGILSLLLLNGYVADRIDGN